MQKLTYMQWLGECRQDFVLNVLSKVYTEVIYRDVECLSDRLKSVTFTYRRTKETYYYKQEEK